MTVLNDRAEIERAEEAVLGAMEQMGYPRASLFAVRLCMHEAISNAFRHGHQGLPPDTPIHVHFEATSERVAIEVRDQGPGFDPLAVPDPTLEENLERGSGRGLLLIRAYMATAAYNQTGNALSMVYQRPSGA